MNKLLPCAGLLAALALAGCATDGPATDGDALRSIVASQIVPPQPRGDAGTDASIAVAAQANYQRSYVSPASQNNSSSFGR